MKPIVRVFADKTSLDRQAAILVSGLLTEAAARGGRATLALSGGETPKGLLELLGSPEYAARVPWAGVSIYWTDERCVPPEHPDSNYGLAKRLLLSKVPVAENNVHRMIGELGAARAAADYESRLRELGKGCDVVLLGAGEDGHTASLFPDSPALAEKTAWAAANDTPKGPRVTMTLPFLNLSGDALVLACGSAKAPIVAAVMEGGGMYPVQRLSPSKPPFWLVDREAAVNILK